MYATLKRTVEIYNSIYQSNWQVLATKEGAYMPILEIYVRHYVPKLEIVM